MLQVRENEISLGKWPRGTAQFAHLRAGAPNLWYASNFQFFTKTWIHSFLVYISGFVSKK